MLGRPSLLVPTTWDSQPQRPGPWSTASCSRVPAVWSLVSRSGWTERTRCRHAKYGVSQDLSARSWLRGVSIGRCALSWWTSACRRSPSGGPRRARGCRVLPTAPPRINGRRSTSCRAIWTARQRCRVKASDMDEETQNTHEIEGPTPGRSRRGVRVRAARLVSVLLILAIIAGAVGWVRFIHIVPAEGPSAYVDIRPGDSVTTLSQQVFALGMTSSPQALRWYWRLKHGGSLREGRYALKGVGDMEALYQLLASGPPLTVRVTFPEGYTVQQMATRLQEQTDISAAGFLKAARNDQGKLLEGHLFPDTYDVLYAGDAGELVARTVSYTHLTLPTIYS